MSTRRRYVRVATLGRNFTQTNIVNTLFYCMFVSLSTFECLKLRGSCQHGIQLLIFTFWVLTPFSPPDGNLYAVGGYDSSSHLATVEKYDPQVKYMQLNLSSKQLVRCQDRLTVEAKHTHLMKLWTCDQCSVSCFNEQSNTWTAIANMLSRRSSAGVAVLDGMLYVAGGNDGTSCLNSVERFNPKTNTWEGVAPMNIRRLVCTHSPYFNRMVLSVKRVTLTVW